MLYLLPAMRTKQEIINDYQVLEAFRHFGGNFEQILGRLYLASNSKDQALIRDTWLTTWKLYALKAARMRAHFGADWWDKPYGYEFD